MIQSPFQLLSFQQLVISTILKSGLFSEMHSSISEIKPTHFTAPLVVLRASKLKITHFRVVSLALNCKEFIFRSEFLTRPSISSPVDDDEGARVANGFHTRNQVPCYVLQRIFCEILFLLSSANNHRGISRHLGEELKSFFYFFLPRYIYYIR